MGPVEPRETARSATRPRAEVALSAARVAALGAVLWAVGAQLAARSSDRAPGIALAIVAAGAWLAWLAARRAGANVAIVGVALAVMAGCGGALTQYAPVALCFLAVAALGAAVALGARRASWVAALGVAAVAAVTGASHSAHRGELVVEAGISVVAGLAAGSSRRQYLERAYQAEQLLAERLRADAERDRAAALAERNRLGRDLHDVLAHSLGALSVQLEAADALFESGDPAGARRLVERSRGLAADGLEEARRAVSALRGDPLGLVEGLAGLAQHEGARLLVEGAEPADLPDDVRVALYRAVQESLTNARKHAPGAPVEIRLSFGATGTELTVTNSAASGPARAPHLAATGGGVGLAGMRERLEHVGGTCETGPSSDGWRVRVAVPT